MPGGGREKSTGCPEETETGTVPIREAPAGGGTDMLAAGGTRPDISDGMPGGGTESIDADADACAPEPINGGGGC